MAIVATTSAVDYGLEPFQGDGILIYPPRQLPHPTATATGSTTPTSSGAYVKAGMLNGYPYYVHATNGLTLWYSDTVDAGTYLLGDSFPDDPTAGDVAWKKLDTPLHEVEETYTPHIGAIGTPFVLLDADNGFPTSGTLVNARAPRARRPAQIKNNVAQLAFAAAIQAVVDIWNNDLTQADRDFWQTISSDRDGARPGMKPSPANGWNLFSQYAYQIHRSGATPPNDWHVLEGTPCKKIWLVHADHADSILTITAEYEARQEGTDFLMIFQIDPAYLGKRDDTRHTHMIGYHAMPPDAPLVDTFTKVAHWQFKKGDTVQILARAHITSLEVQNFTPAIRAS